MHGVVDDQSFSERCIPMVDDLKRVVAWENLPRKARTIVLSGALPKAGY
jgi:hypothetical protein